MTDVSELIGEFDADSAVAEAADRVSKLDTRAGACIGVALPGVDPITTCVETIPLAILFEASIWLSVILEKRWHPETAPLPI